MYTELPTIFNVPFWGGIMCALTVRLSNRAAAHGTTIVSTILQINRITKHPCFNGLVLHR